MIKTRHFTLTPVIETDFLDFHSLDINPSVMKFIRPPSIDEYQSRPRFQKLLDYNDRFPDRGAFCVRTHEGEFVGIGYLVHLELDDQKNPDHEVGYRLAEKFWGRGYATEIAKALIDFGFSHLGLERIYGTTNPDHIVSQKVLVKAGLRDQGLGSYYGGCRLFMIEKPST